jgi:hypothetical protein
MKDWAQVTAAVQVHRFLSPLKGCACSCAREEGVLVNPTHVIERGGELVWETRTNIPGCQVFEVNRNVIALRDNENAALALDRSAARKLHFLLRPESCQCGCLLDRIGNAVQRSPSEQPQIPVPALWARPNVLPHSIGDAGEIVYSAPDLENALGFAVRLQQENRYQYFRGQENSSWLPYPSLSRVLINQVCQVRSG